MKSESFLWCKWCSLRKDFASLKQTPEEIWRWSCVDVINRGLPKEHYKCLMCEGPFSLLSEGFHCLQSFLFNIFCNIVKNPWDVFVFSLYCLFYFIGLFLIGNCSRKQQEKCVCENVRYREKTWNRIQTPVTCTGCIFFPVIFFFCKVVVLFSSRLKLWRNRSSNRYFVPVCEVHKSETNYQKRKNLGWGVVFKQTKLLEKLLSLEDQVMGFW